MIGIGFNAFIHDTAAAVLDDGRTLAMAEEERFNREKHTTQFPERAIEYCLKTSGVKMSQVDYVAFYWDPFAGFFRRAMQTLKNFPSSLKPLFTHQLDNFKNIRNVESAFRRKYGFTGEFHYVNHYLAHAAHAAYRSPFESASILIVDGNGEIATTWLGKLTDQGRIEKIKEVYYPHSIGLVWCTVTEYLGFRQNSDEGKVMGLSALGDACMVDPFSAIFDYKGRGEFEVDLSYFDYHTSRSRWFSEKFVKVFGQPRSKGGKLTTRHMTLARAIQTNTQIMLKYLAKDLVEMTGIKDLAYTGGVALNCVANGDLLKSGIVDHMYIPPAAYDAGAAEGAALYVHHMLYGKKAGNAASSPYLGPEFTNDEIQKALEKGDISFRKTNDVTGETAQLIADGNIVGWFQGRLESGPRALGNRSILADPRPDTMKDHLNSRVKHREWFRPFGPSVLAEKASEVFETGGRLSPYMLFAFDVRPSWRSRIPAVVHVDYTSRIQTVEQEDNPRYHELISRFEMLSGVPLVLNTSFNVMGEPIVLSPKNAIDCFMSTGIDVLAIGDFICEKKK